MPTLYKAIILGILAAFFFAFTFIFNALMTSNGRHWIWSSSLRFYWMFVFFLVIVLARKNLKPLLTDIKNNLFTWLLWSTIGFGLFYAPLTYSANFTPSWLVASTWQFTIIAGVILAPFIYKSRTFFSLSNFLLSMIILIGIIIMQISQMNVIEPKAMFIGSAWIILAAFCYPLGNRKMILFTNSKFDIYQRILGMTLCSLPFWILLSLYAIFVDHSLPNLEQINQTAIVGLFSGLMGTTLFFYATDIVRKNHKAIACTESTQSAEVIFTLIGEIVFLSSPMPSISTLIGMAIIVIGMIFYSFSSK